MLDVSLLLLCTAPLGREEMSTSEESGVVGRDVAVLNEGRSSDVKDGEGGRGVGGLL